MTEVMSEQTATRNVLVVDDDPEIVALVCAALELRGYTADAACDTNQALAMIERESPDLVVLDMIMPKRSGFHVLEMIHRRATARLPVIMITANGESRHQVYAEMLGAGDYIRKPFSMDRLLDSVDRAISQPMEPKTCGDLAAAL